MAKKMSVVYLNHWQLLFRRYDGEENRSAIVDTFADYLAGESMDEYEVPGSCIMYGNVYGEKGFEDGTNVFTSSVQSVKRINISVKNGVRSDLLCAETENGNKYYFFSDELNRYMFLLMRDSMSGKILNDVESYYIDPYVQAKHPGFF